MMMPFDDPPPGTLHIVVGSAALALCALWLLLALLHAACG